MLLNCDMGESFGAWTMGLDEQVMPYIDQANIACGYHAGDPGVMRRTVQLARQHGVQIGAHPAYPDKEGFGRRSMKCSAQEITDMLLYQIGALQLIAQTEGAQLGYVKPHGALYNDMLHEPAVLTAVLNALNQIPQKVALMAPATADNQSLRSACEQHAVPVILEAFADRAYDAQGRLVPRQQSGAVHQQQSIIVQQAQALAKGEAIRALSGESLLLHADSLCVHGDNAESVAAVKAIRAALDESSASAGQGKRS